MTTALAWGFVAAYLLWAVGVLDNLLAAVAFLAAWGASAIVRETVETAKSRAFWGGITVEKEE